MRRLVAVSPKYVALVWLFLHTFAGQTYAQGTPTAPDCSISATLSAAGQTTPFSTGTCAFNQTGPWVWTAAYYSEGFSAISLLVQSAQDSGGAPATWGSFSGSVNASEGCGANPCTITTSSFIVLTGYNPWVRVILSSVTGSGSVHVTLYGSRNPGSGGGSGGGGGGSGCSSPCTVIGPTATGSAPANPPVLTAGWDLTDLHTFVTDVVGRPLDGAYPSNAPVSLSTSGMTQIVAATSGKTITVSHYSIGFASGVNFQLEYGTGSNCGSGTTALTGVYQSIVSIAIDVPFTVPSGNALCANLGSSVAGGGFIAYSVP